MLLAKSQFWLVALATCIATLPAVADETYLLPDGRRVSPLDIIQDCDLCPALVVLPLGRFAFGSTKAEAEEAYRRLSLNKNLDPDREGSVSRLQTFLIETPKHDVEIDLPIAMGRNEVTRAEWGACVADGRCTDEFDERIHRRAPEGPYQDDPRSPIVGITKLEMQHYVAWLNDKLGEDLYRLPTEVEWEYAARAGTKTRFAQGDTLTRRQANFAISRATQTDGIIEWHYDPGNERRPVSVDSLDAANAWGLRHMAGNVMEVTSSCGADRHLGYETSSRYLADSYALLGCKRVEKDCFYLLDAELCRPARRVMTSEDHWSVWTGFRVVRKMEAAKAD